MRVTGVIKDYITRDVNKKYQEKVVLSIMEQFVTFSEE